MVGRVDHALRADAASAREALADGVHPQVVAVQDGAGVGPELHRDPVRARKELDDLETLARRTTREIRTMLFTLRPQILETQGLAAAVEQYANKLQEDAAFEIHLELMDLGDAFTLVEVRGLWYEVFLRAGA